jgi:hypothetical protein
MPAFKYPVEEGPAYSEIFSPARYLRNKNIAAVSASTWPEDKNSITKLRLLV